MTNLSSSPGSKQTLVKTLTRLIVAGFAVVLLILGGLAIHQARLLASFEDLYNQDVKNELNATYIRHLFKTQVQEWKNVLIRGHQDDKRTKYWTRFQEREKEVQKRGNELLGRLEYHPEAAAKLKEFLASHQSMTEKYRAGFDKFTQSGYQHTEGDAAVSGIDRAATKLLDELIEIIDNKSNANEADIISSANTAISSIIPISFLVTIATVFGLIWFLRNNIAEPLNALLKNIGHFSEGDFSKDVHIQGKGEILALNQSLKRMQENMREIISKLIADASVLKSTSESFSANVVTVTEQFSDVQHRAELVATATHEMSSASQEISRSAQGAAEASIEADNHAQQGLQVMTQTIDSINRLAHDVEEVTGMMNQLEESTSSIGSVLDVIKGIAEQTNLLALNAAIEAARAGEQGRGFAVVADEVRTLAQRTQESTEEIQNIIETVQSGASKAVTAMRKGRDQTKDCVSLAENTGVAIQSITDSVDSIKSMNTQIAAAAEEQNAVSEDISQNITNVASLSSETQSKIQENSSLAKELDNMAANLNQIAARFRL